VYNKNFQPLGLDTTSLNIHEQKGGGKESKKEGRSTPPIVPQKGPQLPHKKFQPLRVANKTSPHFTALQRGKKED
jgi:hypothetical protein